MASAITITSVSGTSPYTIYVCDVLGTHCTFIQSGVTTIPVTLTLPTLFDHAPAVMVKVVDANNCETFLIESCNTNPYLIVYNEGLCGTYYVMSGGTTNGRPVYTYVNDSIFYSAQTITIYWDGVDRWVAQKTDTLDICVELIFDRPVPEGTTSEWTNGPQGPCNCTGAESFFYTEFVS